jgi:hypothetical protein
MDSEKLLGVGDRPKPKFKARPPYIVWSPDGPTPPVVPHPTHGAALAIAHMMAKRHPGQTFRVMENAGRPIVVEQALATDDRPQGNQSNAADFSQKQAVPGEKEISPATPENGLREALETANRALAFYADPAIYTPLAVVPGPGTMPILAADAGLIARSALQHNTGERDDG